MIILEAIIYILPTYITNSAMTLTLSLPFLRDWRSPIDFGKSWKGKRILGDGKSFQGLFFGTFWGGVTGLVQYFIAQRFQFTHLSRFNEFTICQFILFGLVLGFGAFLGDLTKSFIKRRIGIKRGKPWPPFDQTDFLIGGLALGSIIYFPGWTVVLILSILTPISHLISNVLAYFLGLKKVWW